MREKIIFISIIVGLILTTYYGNISFNRIDLNESNLQLQFQPPEGSTEELYQDIFLSFLGPYIDDVILEFYGIPYSVDPWDIKILNIERPNGYRSYYFIMDIEVYPYIGPHNRVGEDQITFGIGYGGDVELINHRHIKDYPLPPDY